jgi:type II secretory pathway pseudopilin PulG
MKTDGRRCNGFTLLELITVVAIMFMMISISVVSYFGMMKGAGMRNSLSNVRAVLLLARQHAITQQSRVFVVFQQDADRGTLLPVAQAGLVEEAISQTEARMAYDLPWITGELVGGEIFNIDARSSGEVKENTRRTIRVSGMSGGLNRDWQKGDRIGFGVADREVLPAGFVFWDGSLSPEAPGPPETIVFNPDGTTGGKSGVPYTITIREQYGNTPAEREIIVDGLTGRITIQ